MGGRGNVYRVRVGGWEGGVMCVPGEGGKMGGRGNMYQVRERGKEGECTR